MIGRKVHDGGSLLTDGPPREWRDDIYIWKCRRCGVIVGTVYNNEPILSEHDCDEQIVLDIMNK